MGGRVFFVCCFFLAFGFVFVRNRQESSKAHSRTSPASIKIFFAKCKTSIRYKKPYNKFC